MAIVTKLSDDLRKQWFVGIVPKDEDLLTIRDFYKTLSEMLRDAGPDWGIVASAATKQHYAADLLVWIRKLPV